MFRAVDFDQHESVHHFADAATGLRAIIAIHSTARGPSAGGTRVWRYDSDEDALRDALRLSRGMSYKNAMADLPLGGGKAVVLRPAVITDRAALLEAYGRCIEQLGGRYVTAEDVGVTPQDMRAVARATRHCAGLPDGDSASGDPSPFTARGVFGGIQACVRRRLGREDLQGVRVAVQGVGHVGADLCRRLAEAGAVLTVTDLDADLVRSVVERTGAQTAPVDAIYDQDVDVFAPCALGAVLNPDTIGRLRCSIVAGAANNQLSESAMGQRLAQRRILYAPDYVINGGGIINVAAEVVARRENRPYDVTWTHAKIDTLMATLAEVLDTAIAKNRSPHDVADEMARARLARPAGSMASSNTEIAPV